jgi:hypothetical protein
MVSAESVDDSTDRGAASPEGVELTSEEASEPLLADKTGVQEESDPRPADANPAMPGRLDASLDAVDPVDAAIAKALEGATER